MAIFKVFLQIFVSLFFRSILTVTASSETSVTCSSPVRLESENILNAAFSSSSHYNESFKAKNSRFSSLGAWKPKGNDSSPWLQIKLNTIENITQVGTRGRHDADEWVNTFNVSYSVDGETFTFYENKVFTGNQDRNSIVINVLPNGLRAQYVRIYPKTHMGATAMRVELYKFSSCAKTCVQPLGMENGNIFDSQITSSTRKNYFYSAWRARLNLKRVGRLKGAWSPLYQDSHQWLQVNFGHVVIVTRIATQGRDDKEEWVNTYSVSFNVLHDGSKFIPYSQGKDLAGNQDRNTVVVNVLMPHIASDRVRIHPTSWYGRISIRVEFYQCQEVLLQTGTEQSTIEKRSLRRRGKTTTKKPGKKTTTSRASTTAKPTTQRTTKATTLRSSITQLETTRTTSTPTLYGSNVSEASKGSQKYVSQQEVYRRLDDVTIGASVIAAQLAIAIFLLVMYIWNRRSILERSSDQEKPTGHVTNGIALDNRPASALSTESQSMDHYYKSLLSKDGRPYSRKYQGLTKSYHRESSEISKAKDYSYAATDLWIPPAKRNSGVALSKPFLTSGDSHGAHDNPVWAREDKDYKKEVLKDDILEPVYESVDRAVQGERVSEEVATSEPPYNVVEGPDPEGPESNVYNVLEGPDPDAEDDQLHIYAAVDNGQVVSDVESSCDRTYDDLDKFRIKTEQPTSLEEKINHRLSIAI